MDDSTTTEQQGAAVSQAQDATDSGAIAMGDGSTDYFAGIDVPSNAADMDGNGSGDADVLNSGQAASEALEAMEASDAKQENDEPTFLSVWQEQRRVVLQERRDKEVEEQRNLEKQAQDDLAEFHTNRQKKIETQQKENRDKEDGLKQDLNSVFKNGTLWEQVGRLVNLQEIKNNDTDSVDRMRNLLIHLKNVKQIKT